MRKVRSRTGKSRMARLASTATEVSSRGGSTGMSASACGVLKVGESALTLSGALDAGAVSGATEQQPSSQDCSIEAGVGVPGALTHSRLEQHSIVVG
ncbi:MAG TPA: hypothetical protein VGI45_12030 [Terracidiphilus sp.]|jgi:hypothetical protein